MPKIQEINHNVVDVSVPGIDAKLHRHTAGQDKWYLHCGGFYAWNIPLNEAIEKSQDVLLRISRDRVTRMIKKTKRNKEYKKIVNSIT